MSKPFQINFLDHVAILVADMERSIQWYEKVLGLKKYQLKAWGEIPIFMLSGKTGVAIFPEDDTSRVDKGLRIHHFAFNVDRDQFDQARVHYEQLGLDYSFQDHQYFHSIYTLDPDGHKVELTTLVVPEDQVYNPEDIR